MGTSPRTVAENEFLATYRLIGIRTSRIAMSIAATLALLIFALYYFFPPLGAHALGGPQLARIGCVVVMGVAAALLILFPDLAMKHYEWVIGLPSAFGVMLASWIAWSR